MKKYKFRVKKTLENTIEVKEENHKKAIYQLIKLLAFADKEVFENSEDANIEFDILLEEIENLNNKKKMKMSKNLKAFIEKLEEKSEENENEFEENLEDYDNGIEDDLPKEHIEILCENCGNCIQIDEEDLL